jgi:hypothetical protein
MSTSSSTHESLTREEDLKGPSVRSFGFTFFIVFSLVGVLPILWSHPVRWWSLGIAAVFLALTVLRPRILEPLNRVWFALGLLLHRCVSPVTMAVVYYAIVTPTGLLLRLLGKDVLGLRYDRSADTYWIERRPPGPAPDTMSRQF